ncbi:MAG TPA: tetraacyldisaccharide 4'-kinase [Thermodesulfovibrionales bacterium]|jgi:tetraacyldisaccharide 4'-kinase|nr:tetraacyldisaccharide 4'-kinase [Thermodesulfovibrionales bacterium]
MGPLEFIYYLGYSFERSRSLKRQRRLPCPVISVGNITVGGTGKTPAVIAIAEKAKERGYHPCILTRGYGGKAKGPCFVSKGSGSLLSVGEAGDEPFLMAERLKGVPVVKGGDRYEAGLFALEELGFQPSSSIHHPLLCILDDGFQHWRLHRDRDILLIDGTDPFGNRRLLPMGRLREPLTEMKRADVIVITKKVLGEKGIVRSSGFSSFDSLIDEIRDNSPDAPLFVAEHLPTGLTTASGKDLPITAISGKTIYGFAGIGNTDSFRETLLSIGTRVSGFKPFRDHVAYSQGDIERISLASKACRADWIVTTEKDIMKIRGYSVPENLVVLRIDFSVDTAFYDALFKEA